MLGDKIRALRLQKNMSQAAASSGICSRSMLSHIETGRTIPSLDLLKKLCARLGVTLRDIHDSPAARDDTSTRLDHLHELLAYKDYEALIRQSKDILRRKQIQMEPLAHLDCLRLLGLGLFHQKRCHEAREQFAAAARIAEQACLIPQRITALTHLGSVHAELGDPHLALDCLQQAEELSLIFPPDPRIHIHLLSRLSHQHLALGSLHRAIQYTRQAMFLGEKTGIYECGGHLLTTLGQIKSRQKKWQAAIACFERALKFFEFLDDPDGIAASRLHLAAALDALGVRAA